MDKVAEYLTTETPTLGVEAQLVPELTHPELFDLPITGWSNDLGVLTSNSSTLIKSLARGNYTK